MPTVRIQGVGNVRFPDSMSANVITAAIESDILSPAGTARRSLASRGLTPDDVKAGRGVTSPEQFSVEGPSGRETAMAGARGVAHGLGLPTSMEEAGVPKTGREAAVRLAEKLADMASFGLYDTTKGAVKDIQEGYAPGIGRPVSDISKPARAYAEGRPPTAAENLAAIESGSALATAGTVAVGGGRAAGQLAKTAPALEASAARGYGEALGGGPLAESIGSQLAERGVIMRDPKAQLPSAVVAEDRVPQFKNPDAAARQVEDLRAKYPDSEVVAQGDEFVVRHRVPEGALPDATSPQSLVNPSRYWSRAAAAATAGGAVGSFAGPAGAFMGAKIGGVIATIAEAAHIAKNVMANPLWRTTSAVIKSDLAKALRSKDFARVSDISAKLLGGLGLDDDFGHDAAVHDAVSASFREANGNPDVARQILSGKKIVYENTDGTEINVPFAVTRSFINQIDWNAPNHDLGMAQGNAQSWQDQAGGASGVQGLTRPPEPANIFE